MKQKLHIMENAIHQKTYSFAALIRFFFFFMVYRNS